MIRTHRAPTITSSVSIRHQGKHTFYSAARFADFPLHQLHATFQLPVLLTRWAVKALRMTRSLTCCTRPTCRGSTYKYYKLAQQPCSL